MNRAGEDRSSVRPTARLSRFGVNQGRHLRLTSKAAQQGINLLNNLLCTTDRTRREPLMKQSDALLEVIRSRGHSSGANATKSLSSLQEQAKITMLVHMSSTNLTINILLEEALNEPDIGTTSRFRWHATAVGIAALWINSAPPSTPPFEDALKEGLNVGLDLSREEREFHQVEQGLVLLFHS